MIEITLPEIGDKVAEILSLKESVCLKGKLMILLYRAGSTGSVGKDEKCLTHAITAKKQTKEEITSNAISLATTQNSVAKMTWNCLEFLKDICQK